MLPPVMPVEIIKVAFKPVNFFERNPALDVPPSESIHARHDRAMLIFATGTQEFNKSTLVSERHQQGTQEISAGSCCSDNKASSKL